MKTLKQLGIIKSNCKSSKIFEEITGGISFLDLPDMKPTEYVLYYWNKYLDSGLNLTADGKTNNSLNGQMFELIIYTLLYKEGIIPFYVQAKVAFVPNVEYDTILYSHDSPICLSLKTSLRERYKQADLESIALKYVHRKSQCYLLSLDGEEVNSVNDKIRKGDVIGLNKAYNCSLEDFNCFIEYLKQETFVLSETIKVIEGRLINKE